MIQGLNLALHSLRLSLWITVWAAASYAIFNGLSSFSVSIIAAAIGLTSAFLAFNSTLCVGRWLKAVERGKTVNNPYRGNAKYTLDPGDLIPVSLIFGLIGFYFAYEVSIGAVPENGMLKLVHDLFGRTGSAFLSTGAGTYLLAVGIELFVGRRNLESKATIGIDSHHTNSRSERHLQINRPVSERATLIDRSRDSVIADAGPLISSNLVKTATHVVTANGFAAFCVLLPLWAPPLMALFAESQPSGPPVGLAMLFGPFVFIPGIAVIWQDIRGSVLARVSLSLSYIAISGTIGFFLTWLALGFTTTY